MSYTMLARRRSPSASCCASRRRCSARAQVSVGCERVSKFWQGSAGSPLGSRACRPGPCNMRHAGPNLQNRPWKPPRRAPSCARPTRLSENSPLRMRLKSSAELKRRGWLAARRAGVQMELGTSTGHEVVRRAAPNGRAATLSFTLRRCAPSSCATPAP